MSVNTITRIYTSTGPNFVTPTPNHVKAALIVPANKFLVTAIPVTAKGKLHRLAVVKASGTGGGTATVELLTSRKPFPVGPNDEAGYATPASPLILYQVLPTQTCTAAAVAAYSEAGYAYENLDGNPTSQESYLYLVLRPSSANETVWDVVIVVTNDLSP